MRARSFLLTIVVFIGAQPLDAGEYVLRFERLVAQGWREKPEQGQVVLLYEMTIRDETPFHCGLVAGNNRLDLSGRAASDGDGNFDLSLRTRFLIAPTREVAEATPEEWSNHFEVALSLDEPATIAPQEGKAWKIIAGNRINARSVARERIRIVLRKCPQNLDQGVQVASGRDPAAPERYTVRISDTALPAVAGGQGAQAEREQREIYFETQPGIPNVVRCAFGTNECLANARLVSYSEGRLRADTAVSFMEHDKSFSPGRLDRPHDVLRQLSARTSVFLRPGEHKSLGDSPVSPTTRDAKLISTGLRIAIDDSTGKGSTLRPREN